MKKLLSLLGIVALTITLSACKSKDKETIIEFWHAFNGTNEKIIIELTDTFNAKYEGQYEIVLTSQGNYDNLKTATNAAIKAKAAPHLVATYPDHVAEYMQSNTVEALDDYIFNAEYGLNKTMSYQRYTKNTDGTYSSQAVEVNNFEDILEIFRNESKSYPGGKILSLPLNKSTEVMYYNKSFFDQHNLQVPRTWEEVKTVALQIKELTKGNSVTFKIGDNPKTFTYPNGQPAIGYDSNSNLFITLAHQSGGGYTKYENNKISYVFDNEKTVTALEMYEGMINDGLAIIPQNLDPNVRYLSDAFVNKLVFMNIGSIAGSVHNDPQGKFTIGVAPVPQMDLNNPKVIQQGTNITMLNQDFPEAHRLIAWEYIKHLTSTEASAKFASETGYLPIRQSSYESEVYQKYLNKADKFTGVIHVGGQAELVAFDQADAFFYDPAFPGSSSLRDEVGLSLQDAYTTDSINIRQQVLDMIAKYRKLGY